MSQRRKLPYLVPSVLPVLLAACNPTTSSIDPRTRPPLVRVAAVQTLRPR